MRIKSYFAPSVQAAIALARKEFGDGVTLVTSHVASLENRHLGEYEVVFAIEEETAAEDVAVELAAEETPVFQNILQQAIETKPSIQVNLPDKLDRLKASFIEIGIEPAMVRALMAMIERCVPSSAPLVPLTSVTPECKPGIEERKAPLPPAAPAPIQMQREPDPVADRDSDGNRYSAAELAFVLSVSGPEKHLGSASFDLARIVRS